MEKTNKLSEEIFKMLRLSNFGNEKHQKNISEKKIIKESDDFIGDLSSVFYNINNDDNKTEETKFSTSGNKVILPIELKAAMLAQNLSRYQATLLNLYTEYKPFTKGATAGQDRNTYIDKDPIEKIKGANSEFQRLKSVGAKDSDVMKHIPGKNWNKEWEDIIKTMRVPITYAGEDIRTKEMPPDEKKEIAKWWTNKTYHMISYTSAGGLTPMGKAQLEFLARAYTGKPNGEEEQELFEILGDEGGHFSEIAESIIREFYTMALVPYIMNLTHRAKFNPYDQQLKIFIEKGLNHALDQLKNFYDPTRGNLGTFIITTVKNDVKNQLKYIADYKLDYQLAQDYLMYNKPPFKIYSVADPSEVEGQYIDKIMTKQAAVSASGKNKKAVWIYIYDDPIKVMEDLQKDARVSGSKPSPIAKKFIVNPSKSLFYKSYPPQYEEVKNALDYHDVDPYSQYNMFTLNQLPGEAKKVISQIFDEIINELSVGKTVPGPNGGTMPNPEFNKYGTKGISAFIKENREFTKQLMFKIFNFGTMIEVYTKAWRVYTTPEKKHVEYPTENVTTIPVGRPVEFITNKEGEKIPLANIDGAKPTSNDTKWAWSTGSQSEQEVKTEFINDFIARMTEKFGKPGSEVEVGKKAIPEKFMEEVTNGSRIIFDQLRKGIRKYFGYEGKNIPTVRQNEEVLNKILKNYSAAALSGELVTEGRRKIFNLGKILLKA